MSTTNSVGSEMFSLIKELYPLCRSITGNGTRKTLQMINRIIPLNITEVPTGTKVFDWFVPKEWNIKEAYLKDMNGRKLVDFRDSNLHVLNYSIPVNKKISIDELKKHLFSMPDRPDWIPYRTSYYKEDWGFCLSNRKYESLEENEYEVFINSTLEDGHLTYGEFFIRGELEDEVLFSTHICHPSLCNDNLSGIALSTFLAQYLTRIKTRLSYRFLFIPGTIGSICWLAKNEEHLHRIKNGLVIACVGDPGKPTYKRSRQGNADIDRAVVHILKNSGLEFEIRDFAPYGYDERQYCSPAFNLPVGSLTRTPFGCYPEYHTSADNLDFIKKESLSESYEIYLKIVNLLEKNRCFMNLNPKCEPQLGKRGIYGSIGGRTDKQMAEMALLWVLNLSDGSKNLLDIAERSGVEFDKIVEAAELLIDHGLLSSC